MSTGDGGGRGGGFSLVEVLVAIGLAAILLTSIAGLYAQALHQVSTAGHLTMAVAATREIMADLDAQRLDEAMESVHGGPPPTTAVNLESDTRDSGSTADGRWGGLVRSRLPGGHAIVRMTGADRPACPVVAAQGVRLTVIVGWSDRGSTRTFQLQTVRF